MMFVISVILIDVGFDSWDSYNLGLISVVMCACAMLLIWDRFSVSIIMFSMVRS